VCEQLDLVTRAGESYYDAATGERLGIGQDNVKALIDSDEALAARLTAAVYATVNSSKVEVPAAETAGDDSYASLEEEI